MAGRKLTFDIEANSDAARQAVAQLRTEFNKTLAELKRQQGDIALFKAAQQDAAKLERQIKALGKAGGDTSALTAALAAQRAALAQQSAALTRAGIDTRKLSSEQARLRVQAEQTTRTFRTQSATVVEALDGTQRKASGFAGALGGAFSRLGFQIAAVLSLGRLGAVVDDFAALQARLRLASRDQTEFNAANADVARIADTARVPLSGIAQLYTRIAASTKDLGTAQKDVAGVVEATALALKISGASAAESDSAMLQFSQALASGVLRGEEFNSIAEAAPRLLQALAKSIGVPVGQLREMAKEGELTRGVLINGLLRALPELRQEAATLPNTISGAFTKLRNDMTLALGQFDELTGASGRFAQVVAAVGTVGIEALAVLGANVAFVFKGVGRELGGIAAQLGALARGDFKAFRFIGEQLRADGEQARKELDAFEKRILEGSKNVAAATQKTVQVTGAATVALAGSLKQQTEDRKKAVDAQIKDAERLRDALVDAFDASLKTERDYIAQAKRLRAEASAKPRDSSVEGQAGATIDLIAAEQRLQNIKGSGSLKDVRAQVELVKQLAAGIDDQARATEAVNRAKNAEADALERAAAGEAQQQGAITEQQRLNDERLKQLQRVAQALEAGKTVTLDADVEDARVAVEQVKTLWDGIESKTVKLDVAGGPGPIPARASGGLLRGPGTGTSDSILARLSNGEYVLRAAAVRSLGRARLDYMNRYGRLPERALAAVRERNAAIAAAARLPRFADGGIVNGVSRLPSPEKIHAASRRVLNLTLPGVGTFETQADETVARSLERALRNAALKSGRRV